MTLSATDGADANASGVDRTEYRVDGGEWQQSENGGGADPFTTAVTVSAAGEHTVRYRSHDAAGNLEASQEVQFTIEGSGGGDTTAPETTAALDPETPGPGGTYDGPVGVTLTATDPDDGGPAPEPQTHDVAAQGTVWAPADVDAATGDAGHLALRRARGVVPARRLARPARRQPGSQRRRHGPGHQRHRAPGRAAGLADVRPGGELVVPVPGPRQLQRRAVVRHDGHGRRRGAGRRRGTPSGVDFTEYRVNTGGETGAWVRSDNSEGDDPFATSFTVSAPGSHTVEYRSTDGAGNAEGTKSVAFSIADDGGEGAPTVQGFADPSSGPAPLRVRFSATGLDPDGGGLTYRWQFEDGTVLGPNATYTFTEPGVHEATVTVTDDEGDTASDTVEVTVTDPGTENEPPTVEASVDEPSGPAPHRVRFDATGNDPDGRNADLVYHWAFGDGGESFARRPGHTYREPGTYTATVTVTDPHGGSATAEVDVEVTDPPGNRPPVVEAAAAPSSGMAPLSTLLSAQGTDPDGDRLTYRWEFGDGQAADGRVAQHVYILGGTYTATVTATDEHGATGTAVVQVVVGNPAGNQAPTVQIAADPPSGTAPLQVRFSSAGSDPDGDALMYVWEFGDGGSAGGPSVTHTYTQPGTYIAKVTVTDAHGATGSASMSVVVSAPAAPRTVAGMGRQVAGAVESVRVPKSVARFRRDGVRLTLTCTGSTSGTASLQVTRGVAKRLGLARRTLVSRNLRCVTGRTVTVRLKPSRAAARRLAARRTRTLKVTLRVAVKGEKAVQRSLTHPPRS